MANRRSAGARPLSLHSVSLIQRIMQERSSNELYNFLGKGGIPSGIDGLHTLNSALSFAKALLSCWLAAGRLLGPGSVDSAPGSGCNTVKQPLRDNPLREHSHYEKCLDCNQTD